MYSYVVARVSALFIMLLDTLSNTSGILAYWPTRQNVHIFQPQNTAYIQCNFQITKLNYCRYVAR